MRDESFDYENRLEHQILWPAEPIEICDSCGDIGRHKLYSCAYCGNKGCRNIMLYSSNYTDWFCDEECLKKCSERNANNAGI